MSEKHWWRDHGSFKKWRECPTRPDPGEVLLFYLQKRGIEPAEHVTYLMDLLDLQKSMVYNILKGAGFDSISRSRQLVQALKIHPPLLGIDGKFYPIEHHAYWWRAYGFSFNADTQGYPLMSEVIPYLRQQRTHIEEGGRVKVWSQVDLADATGLQKETIYRMEHDNNPLAFESISRRAIVASALGNLAGENEPTIFRLCGLDPQAYRVPVPASEAVAVVHLPHPALSHEILQERHKKLQALFSEYSKGHAQDRTGELLELLMESQALLSRANTTGQRVSLLALQSRYHRLLACIASEQCQKSSILFHTNTAVKLAEQAMTLPNPKQSCDHVHMLTTHELFASALFTRAMAYYELKEYELAHKSIDQALHIWSKLQSRQLKTEILGANALMSAYTANSSMDQQLVLSYIDRAVQLTRANQPQVAVPDENFFWCDKSTPYIYKARALLSPRMKNVRAERVSDLLECAQRLANPEKIRQHVIIESLQAECHFLAGDYQQATKDALSALEKCSQIRSCLWRNTLEGLYKQLLTTSSRDKSIVAYFGMVLRTWDHGMG